MLYWQLLQSAMTCWIIQILRQGTASLVLNFGFSLLSGSASFLCAVLMSPQRVRQCCPQIEWSLTWLSSFFPHLGRKCRVPVDPVGKYPKPNIFDCMCAINAHPKPVLSCACVQCMEVKDLHACAKRDPISQDACRSHASVPTPAWLDRSCHFGRSVYTRYPEVPVECTSQFICKYSVSLFGRKLHAPLLSLYIRKQVNEL